MKHFLYGILMIFLVSNGIGLLVGFEDGAPICRSYTMNERTNFEYYALPIAPYACKENGGLLQPYVADFFEWFGEVHK